MVIRNTNTSVVVTWGASKDVKHLVGYYIECSQTGTDIWMACNNKPVKETRSASFTLIPTLESQIWCLVQALRRTCEEMNQKFYGNIKCVLSSGSCVTA